MTDLDAPERLHDAAALWSAGHGEAVAVIGAACDALADGADGYALAMLAALPLHTSNEDDVEGLLDQALDEVGLRYYPRFSREADEAALAVMARLTLAGTLTPRALASWSHRVFGHDRLPLAEQLALLDDVYDTIEYTDMTLAEIDTDVIVEAKRIAEGAARTRPGARA